MHFPYSFVSYLPVGIEPLVSVAILLSGLAAILIPFRGERPALAFDRESIEQLIGPRSLKVRIQAACLLLLIGLGGYVALAKGFSGSLGFGSLFILLMLVLALVILPDGKLRDALFRISGLWLAIVGAITVLACAANLTLAVIQLRIYSGPRYEVWLPFKETPFLFFVFVAGSCLLMAASLGQLRTYIYDIIEGFHVPSRRSEGKPESQRVSGSRRPRPRGQAKRS